MLVTTSILYFVLPGKEPACQCSRLKRHRFDSWVWKILGRRTWQPTPIFSPEESHGQRSLAAYSLWGCKESDRTERLKKKRERNHILTKQRQEILGQGRDLGYMFKPGWTLPNSVAFRSCSTSLDPVDSLVKLKC